MAILKVIEVLAESKNSWEDATYIAVKEASRTVKEISSVKVEDMTAKVEDDNIVAYTVRVKITFQVYK